MGLSGFEPPASPGLAPKSGETERRANAPAFVPGVTQLFGVGTSSRSVKVSHFSPVDASYQAGKEAKEAIRRGTSESVTDSSVLSNLADAQNVSCLGLCGRDICPKSSA